MTAMKQKEEKRRKKVSVLMKLRCLCEFFFVHKILMEENLTEKGLNFNVKPLASFVFALYICTKIDA